MRLNSKASESSLTLDVELRRGIVITGRVIDSATGKGINSGIRFDPLPGNKYANEPGYDFHRHSGVMESTDAEARFRIVEIPGPGVLIVQASHMETIGEHELKPFRQASFSKEDRERVFAEVGKSIWLYETENAVKYLDLDLDPKGGAVQCDLVLDRGTTVNVEIQDNAGQPLTGVMAAGLAESWPYTFTLTKSRCTVCALGPDRPRKVFFLHPTRRLAGSLLLTGQEKSPVTVRLRPAGAIKGRAVDEAGASLDGLKVALNIAFEERTARELYRFLDMDQPLARTRTSRDDSTSIFSSPTRSSPWTLATATAATTAPTCPATSGRPADKRETTAT